MAGYALAALDINNRAGALSLGLWQALEDAHKFKQWLDDATHTDTVLGPTGVGVTTADLLIIRNSFADLAGTSGLYAVAHGTFAPTGASNYFSNAKQLVGVNYAG
jgi:hypothetical protein